MNIDDRIKDLRSLMRDKDIAAYIVPSYDPHQSEYLADHYRTRVWISGFTGSAGTVVITEDEAILWTDGRYFIQAGTELKGSEVKLFKIGIPGFPTYMEWLTDNLDNGDILGFDGRILPQSDVKKLEEHLGNKDIEMIDEYDLVGMLWRDRPEVPMGKAFVHDIRYTGMTAEEKVADIRKEMRKRDVDYFLLGSLDDIAWAYNIRGKDVENNPVVISYGLISKDEALLFVDKEKISEEVESHLSGNGIGIKGYEDVIDYIKSIRSGCRVFLDPSRINRWLYNGIPEGCQIVEGINITTEMKAIKNETEIRNQRNAYIKDGVALTRFLYWLDKNVGNMKITEISAAERLEEFRREQEGFIEPSFDTIAAYKENAAMMHYSADDDSNYELKREGLFLVDSGGQYYDGTTDITRTIVLGEITEEEKRDYTLTLKGHINLINARFLYGVTGTHLDTLARYPLWQEGLDYKSGTGHGIGYLLNVHEGPHRISPVLNDIRLEKGMVVTIEPGVYKEGKHGIRIENVAVVEDDIETESGQFMRFETISYCPIDLDGIDIGLLTEDEIGWLNDYHNEVYDRLSPYLDDKEKEWLKEQTRDM